jgi:hypothetical protein
MDFPRAWEIARLVPKKDHHPKCSFRVTDGGLLCDCEVITRHSEYEEKTNEQSSRSLRYISL